LDSPLYLHRKAEYGKDMVNYVEHTLVSACGVVRIDSILGWVIATAVSAVRPIQGIEEVIERST